MSLKRGVAALITFLSFQRHSEHATTLSHVFRTAKQNIIESCACIIVKRRGKGALVYTTDLSSVEIQ